MEPNEQTQTAAEFGAVMHETLTRLEKAESNAKHVSEYADSVVTRLNEYLRKFNDAEGELTELRAIVAELRPSEQAAVEDALKSDVKPLPCIVCGIQPGPAFPTYGGSRQPYGATMFNAGSGHYGSTVWDAITGGRSLEINVCDTCLVERKDRVAMVVETVEREYDYLPWRVDDEENPDV